MREPYKFDLWAGVLGVAPGGGPVGERLELVAVFPGEVEKFVDVEIGGFFTEKGFEAPLDVGAVPRMEAIAARSEPVELDKMPHGRSN